MWDPGWPSWGAISLGGSETMPYSNLRSSVLAGVARRLMVATALVGLVDGSAFAASTKSVYTFGDSGSTCAGGNSCATLLSPTSVRLWGNLTFSNAQPTGIAAFVLQGNGSAMTTNVLDVSLPSMLLKTNPGSDRTTIDALSATYTAATGEIGRVDMSIDRLVTAAPDGSYAKSDILKAASAWDQAEATLAPSSTRIDPVTWLSTQSTRQLSTFVQPELAALPVAQDGTVAAADAQIAVAKVLFRSLTTSDLQARDGGFITQLTTLDTDHDGRVSMAAIRGLMHFDQMPQAQQDYYAASIPRVLAMLSGSETTVAGEVTYEIEDFVRAAEADGSAYDRVYGHTGNTLSTATRASLRSILNWNDTQNPTFASNVTSLFLPEYDAYLSGSTLVDPARRLALAQSLIADGTVVLRSAGGVTVTNGQGILATNTGAITLTSDVAITVDGGSGVVGLQASRTGGTGDVSVTNRGTVTLGAANSTAVGAKATSGAGSIAVANEGAIKVTAAGTAAMNGKGLNGGNVTVTNAAGATIDVTGQGSYGMVGSSTSGTTTVSNDGSVSVVGGWAGLAARSDTGASAEARNAGSVSVRTDGLTGPSNSVGAVLVGGGAKSAKASNTGSVTTIGDYVNGIRVGSTSTDGTADASNAGTVSVTGQGTAALQAFTNGGGAASATNAGKVTLTGADGLGVSAWSTAGTATVSNAATGEVSVKGTGAKALLAEAMGGPAAVTLRNEGTASSAGASAIGAAARSVDGAVTIANLGTIDASGVDAIAMKALSTGGAITITNTGTITGPEALVATSSTGLVTVDNAGLLDGSVTLGGSSVQMKNAGRVTGTVTLGAGDDVFAMASGSVVGKVVAGAGRDLLDVTEVAGKTRTLDAANFVGFEKVRLAGDGGWVLGGDFSSADFGITGGRTQFDGRLGAVELAGGTVFMGSGTVASLATKGATIAPGDTHAGVGLGTITVLGDLTLDTSSTVLVDVVGARADNFVVGGTAHLAGTLMLRGADVVGGKTIEIVTAKSVDRTFSSWTWTEGGKWDFLGMEVLYGPTSVTLKSSDPVSAAKENLTSESRSFLNDVFGETPVMTSDTQATAYQTIGTLISDAQGDEVKIQKTMDEVSGRAAVVGAAAGTVAVQAVDQAVARAGDAAIGGGGGGAGGGMTMAYFDDRADITPAQKAIGRVLYDKVPRADARSLMAWTTGQFGFGSATSGASQSDFRSGGMTVGIIKRIDEAFSVGFAGGYTRSDIDIDNPGAHLGIDSYHFLAHGSWDTDRFRLNGLVGYAFQHFGGRRDVAGGSANASYDGGSIRFGVDGGYKLNWNNHVFMPFAGLDVIHGWSGGYTETNAPGGLNLTMEEARTDTIDGRIGLKWSTRRTISPGVVLEPLASVAWIHAFGDANSKLHASMLGNSFVMTGASRNRDALALATGLTAEIGDNFSIFGRYSGRLASDVTAHDFSAGLRYRW